LPRMSQKGRIREGRSRVILFNFCSGSDHLDSSCV
jgi:hypothetical protein